MSSANQLLKNKVGPWQQAIHRWRASRNVPFRTKFFVGYDLDGNTYWEFQNYNDPARMRRIVEYRQKGFSHVDYVGTQIAPQWVQWLRHNRPSHPTLEELYNDQLRQDNLKGLIRQADQRWNEKPLKDQEEFGAAQAAQLHAKAQATGQTSASGNQNSAARHNGNIGQNEFVPGSWNPSFRAKGRE